MHTVFPGERKDERHGDDCPDERTERNKLRLSRQQDHDAHGGEPRTGGNTDDSGVGKRVFQNALENAAREREIDARQCTRDDARQPNMPENAIVLRTAASQKCREKIMRSDLDHTR